MDTIQRPFAWSYSKLNNFRTCAKKYYHTTVAKDFVEGENVNRTWGDEVHAAMEARISKGTPLPEGMKQWEKHALRVLENSDPNHVVTYTEKKLAITEDFKPCEYFDKRVPVWFRTVADVLKIRGPIGRIVDWKTGRVDEDSTQLDLIAAAAFAHFPLLTHVIANFVWLKEDLWGAERLIIRDRQGAFWATMLPQVDELKLAHATGVFPPNPSGLCKKHCPVISCAYHGRGAY